MLQGVPQALGWNPQDLPAPGQLMTVSDTVKSDASAFIHDMVNFYLRQGFPVAFISFGEHLDRLVGVYRRLGIDLNMLEAQQNFKFVDGDAAEIIHDQIDQLRKGAPRYLVVIDDMAVFEAMDHLNEAICMVKELEKRGNHQDILIRFHSSDTTVEESKLWRWLCHRSTVCLLVSPLSSGISKEVHGQLDVLHGGRSFLHPRIPSNPFLFRSTEASLFFSPKIN